MANSKKSVNVRVKLFSQEGIRCAFPHFFVPWANEGDDEDKAKYQALIALDKEYDTSLIKKVEAGVKEVVKEFWGAKDVKRIGKSIDSPLVDGEEKAKYPVLENYYTLSAKKSGTNRNGKELPPPKMMVVKDGQYITPEHKDWDEDLMLTGRYCFVIDLYTSENANSRGDKVCVGLVSILALPALEGDDEEIMPGFGAIESDVEDDFGEFLDDLGVKAAIPSSSAEFEDDDEPEEDLDESDDDLDEELDSEPEEDDDEEDEPESVVEEKPKAKRGRPRGSSSTRTRAKKPAATGEDESPTPRKTKRTRAARPARTRAAK